MFLATIILAAVAGLVADVHAQLPPRLRPSPDVCVGRPVGTLFPDFGDCNAFYRCTGGAEFARGVCVPHLRFSAVLGDCVQPERAGCFACPANVGFVDLPVTGACDQFVRCLGGQQPQHERCGDGLRFDQRLNQCNEADRVSCPAALCPAVDEGRHVMVRDTVDCAVYYVCVAGRPWRQECAPTLVFNEQTQLCELQSETSIGCGAIVPPFSCAAQDQTQGPNFPHPTDCSAWYICAGDMAIERRCPAGTGFDVISRGCAPDGMARCAPGARSIGGA